MCRARGNQNINQNNNMNMEDVKNNTATVAPIVETPKSVATPAQIKSPINFGAQGVKLASLE